MQTQYDAGNLKGYLDYKQFWDFMDTARGGSRRKGSRGTGRRWSRMAIRKNPMKRGGIMPGGGRHPGYGAAGDG